MSKNFLDFLDGLPLEQQQPVIDNFVDTLLGKPKDSLVRVKSLTVSNDTSIDEKIKLIAIAYNIDPAIINRANFELSEKELTDSKYYINELIKDQYNRDNETGQRGKNDELISLGKFLYTAALSYKISSTEIPDFILYNDLEKIGIEHTRLEAELDKAFISELWKKYLKGSVALILDKIPDLTGVANITLDTDIPIFEGSSLRNFKSKDIKKNIKNIHQSLADYIISIINKNKPKPTIFIKSATYQPSNESFTLKYNQDYFVRTDFEKMLITAIQKKEKRLDAYIKNTNIDTHWLLIVYSNESFSSGFKINKNSLTSMIDSSFDRIFILNSFNLACYELQRVQPYLKYIAKKQYSQLSLI